MATRLYDFAHSANSYRVRLLLALLRVEHDVQKVDLLTRAQHDPEFLALNPLGQVPVLVEDGEVISDSHVIILHLAERHGSAYLPADPAERRAVLQWLFFDANELHNGIGLARNFFAFGVGRDGEGPRERGVRGLRLLDNALGPSDWLVGGAPTLADIACYPLTTVVKQAGIDPAPFENVARWQGRIEALDGYVPML